MRRNHVPTSNFTYADADGNILYFWNARLPVRSDGRDYRLDIEAQIIRRRLDAPAFDRRLPAAAESAGRLHPERQQSAAVRVAARSDRHVRLPAAVRARPARPSSAARARHARAAAAVLGAGRDRLKYSTPRAARRAGQARRHRRRALDRRRVGGCARRSRRARGVGRHACRLAAAAPSCSSGSGICIPAPSGRRSRRPGRRPIQRRRRRGIADRGRGRAAPRRGGACRA